VSGHIDGIGEVVSRHSDPRADSWSCYHRFDWRAISADASTKSTKNLLYQDLG
jgi:hypothetical protein